MSATNLLGTIGLADPTTLSGTWEFTGLGFYLIADDRSVSALSVFQGNAGSDAFVGYPAGASEYAGLPHGPLSLQYIARTITYSEDPGGVLQL